MDTNLLEELLDSDSDDELISACLNASTSNQRKRKYNNGNENGLLWMNTLLYKMFTCASMQEKLADESTKEYKTFRRRYRMSYPVFTKFLEEVMPLFQVNEASAFKLRLKILAVLHYLGRGSTIDDVSEVSGIGEETLRQFARQFCRLVATKLYDKWINIHKEGPNSIAAATYPGLPGCLGSVDGVHVAWERCPAMRANRYTGKAGHPTVAFNVACDHTRRIISCTSGFAGSFNDKTIVLSDNFVDRVRKDSEFTNFEFTLQNAAGGEEKERGCYLLCDGGYRLWRVLQSPSKLSTDHGIRTISAVIEAYRKDIECTFGVLKKRFKILKYPLLAKQKRDVDCIFISCCVIHNMLLEWNHSYVHQQEPDINVENSVPGNRQVLLNSTDKATFLLDDDTDDSGDENPRLGFHQTHPSRNTKSNESDAMEKKMFVQLRTKLITHWIYHHPNPLPV